MADSRSSLFIKDPGIWQSVQAATAAQSSLTRSAQKSILFLLMAAGKNVNLLLGVALVGAVAAAWWLGRAPAAGPAPQTTASASPSGAASPAPSSGIPAMAPQPPAL